MISILKGGVFTDRERLLTKGGRVYCQGASTDKMGVFIVRECLLIKRACLLSGASSDYRGVFTVRERLLIKGGVFTVRECLPIKGWLLVM